jgi:hypothetical protein
MCKLLDVLYISCSLCFGNSRVFFKVSDFIWEAPLAAGIPQGICLLVRLAEDISDSLSGVHQLKNYLAQR